MSHFLDSQLRTDLPPLAPNSIPTPQPRAHHRRQFFSQTYQIIIRSPHPQFQVRHTQSVMDLPKLGLFNHGHVGIAFDISDHGLDAPTMTAVGVRHQQHETEGMHEARAEETHADGNCRGEGTVQPSVHLNGKKGKEQEER